MHMYINIHTAYIYVQLQHDVLKIAEQHDARMKHEID